MYCSATDFQDMVSFAAVALFSAYVSLRSGLDRRVITALDIASGDLNGTMIPLSHFSIISGAILTGVEITGSPHAIDSSRVKGRPSKRLGRMCADFQGR